MSKANVTNTFQAEKVRLADIVSLIERRAESVRNSQGGVRQDVTEIRRTFWDDVTVNIDNPEDAVETLASIRQQAELLSERERAHGHMSRQLKTLNLLKDSPYFGRVDFLEKGEASSDIVYLGISSLMDDAKENFLIYDWRAPISSIYYDYSPGPAQYDTPGGIIEGEMEQKRQYIIKGGQLISLFDTAITIGDEILKEVLGKNADSQMKNIVATIQKEQNAVIRNDDKRYLVVQGAAGSGKTSAALQRVAFLLYRHVHEIKADHILLFSPNPLFSSYTSTVLPSLGEDNMQQVTFFDYMAKMIGDDYHVSDPFEQMEYVLQEEVDDDCYKARLEAIRYKNTLEFKNVLDHYSQSLSHSGLQFKNIVLRKKTLIASSDIADYFYSLDPLLSIQDRLAFVKEWLLKELYRIEKLERRSEWVEEEIELLETADYTNAFRQMRKRKSYKEDTFDDFEREQQELAKKVTHKYFKPIRIAIKQFRFLNAKKLYKDLFQEHTAEQLGMGGSIPSNWEEIRRMTLTEINQNRLPYEDAASYLYFKEGLEGIRTNRQIRYLFIDEAQDYSAFQLEVIKQLFPNGRMTILGDINQAIYAHSYGTQTLLSEELYRADETERITLWKSYRSTRQIIDFTSSILGDNQIQPFNRSGMLPVLYKRTDMEASYKLINQLLESLKEAQHQTIAIICKTQYEANMTFERLKSIDHVQLMDKSIYSFTKGTLILPAYLAKGIEFDAVILFNASMEQYHREQERNLFYTACTRAMHELHILSCGEPTPFFKTIPNDRYVLR